MSRIGFWIVWQGTIIVGTKGTIYDSRVLAKVEEPKVEFPQSPGHFEEFVRAIRGGPPPPCPPSPTTPAR